MKIMLIRKVCLWMGLANVQLDRRDADGLRKMASSKGDSAIKKEELSQGYGRASASWIDVFGEEACENVQRGEQWGMDALKKGDVWARSPVKALRCWMRGAMRRGWSQASAESN